MAETNNFDPNDTPPVPEENNPAELVSTNGGLEGGETDLNSALRESLQFQNEQRAEAQKARVEAAQTKLQPKASDNSKKDLADQAKSKAIQTEDRAVKQVAKETAQAAKQVAKQAARATGAVIKKMAAGLIANPYILGALGILLLIIIVIVIVFSMFGFSRETGKGPAIYPNSTAQFQQATLLSALSGNKISNNKITKDVIDDEKSRYGRIKANAEKYSPDLIDSVAKKITEFTPLLDSLLATGDRAQREKIRDETEKSMFEFEKTLPFGKWIVEIAKTHVGEPTQDFCRITGASGKLACASFSSSTLWEAGVPNAIVSNTTALWSNKSLRTVIDRADTASNSRINENVMKPGDVVWFGNGNKAQSRYAGALFDHVGIYIGDGQIIDSSSTTQKIMKRKLTTHAFNGAKRYGSD